MTQSEYIIQLEQQNTVLLARISELTSQIENQNHQIDNLTEMLIQMRRDKFGPSSEKTPRVEVSDQIYMPQVFNEVEVEADDSTKEPCKITKENKVRAKSKGTRKELLLKDLPITEVVYQADEASRTCPRCGEPLKEIGKKFIRDELEYIPAQLKIIKYYQTSYECPECKHTDHPFIANAAAPKSLLNHSLASASSVANVMYQKYVNAMPLYRQEKDWEDLGIALSRATMANWIIRCYEDYFDPLVDLLQDKLIKRDIVHCDETPVQVLKEPDKTPQTKSYMWVYKTGNDGKEPIVIYDYNPSRKGDCAANFLKDFRGFIHTDGFSGYNKLNDVTRCGCWAHLRRKFVEACPEKKIEGSSKTVAEVGRDFCNQLFDIERTLKDLTPEDRYTRRLELEKPVLKAFWCWLDEQNPLGGGKLSKAIHYAREQKPYLENYLLDGRCSISNNTAENAIRPFTVGRKNWLFSDTAKGAEASAAIYSIVETAKANGLEVYSYLEYLLDNVRDLDWQRHPERLDNMMPWSETVKAECSR